MDFSKRGSFHPDQVVLKLSVWVYVCMKWPCLPSCAWKELCSVWVPWCSAEHHSSALTSSPPVSGRTTKKAAKVAFDVALTGRVCHCVGAASGGRDHQLTVHGLTSPEPPLGDKSDVLCNSVSFLNMFSYFYLHNWKCTWQLLKYRFHSSTAASVF